MHRIQTVLVTGASGFVGSQVASALHNSSCFSVVGSVRRLIPDVVCDFQRVEIGDIGEKTDWSAALAGVDVVVHTAGLAHFVPTRHSDSILEYRRINVTGTRLLAQQAAASGVRRLVFISSVGVHGRAKSDPFRESDIPAPEDVPAIAKYEAEEELRRISAATGLEVVIVRAPLIYGRNAPGNFKRLVGLVCSGFPLPLGAINNRRSLVGIDNLVEFIILCIFHERAANEVFLIGDGEDISTSDLIKKMAQAAGCSVPLVHIPVGIMYFAARLLGKKDVADKLLGSLQVDISKARSLLGWQPPLSVDEGMRRCFILEDLR